MRKTRLTDSQRLAQLREDKSPLLLTYLNIIYPATYPSDICPLCNVMQHNAADLFNCLSLSTDLSTEELWRNPIGAAELLVRWGETLGLPRIG